MTVETCSTSQSDPDVDQGGHSMRADPGNEALTPPAEDSEAYWPVIEPMRANTGVPRTTIGDPAATTGYCLWEFDGSAWMLKKDRCQPGAVPSAAPSEPGRFRGQLRAVMAVPAQAAAAGSTTAGRPDDE
jgi:hypothetical protein